MKYSSKHLEIDLDLRSILACLLILVVFVQCTYSVTGPHNCADAKAAEASAKEELDAAPSLPQTEMDAIEYRSAWYKYTDALDKKLSLCKQERSY